LYSSLILPYLTYGIEVWGNNYKSYKSLWNPDAQINKEIIFGSKEINTLINLNKSDSEDFY